MAQRPLKGLYHRQPDCCPRLSFLCPGSPFLLLTGSWHPSQTPSLARLCRGISRKALLPVCGEALPGWGYKGSPKHTMQSQGPPPSHRAGRARVPTPALREPPGPPITCSHTHAGPQNGATLPAGAGKRSFVHEQSICQSLLALWPDSCLTPNPLFEPPVASDRDPVALSPILLFPV